MSAAAPECVLRSACELGEGPVWRAADQAVDIGPHSHTSLDFQLDSVLGHSRNHRSFDYTGINAHLNGFQHIASCQVNGAGSFQRQRNLRPGGGHH